MDTKTLKVLGVVVSAAGMLLNLMGSVISGKQQEAEINKAVAEAIKKQH